MMQATFPVPERGLVLPRSFAAWRARLRADGALPVVAVAGSRGKTTVVRLLDAMFRQAGLRTALWTDLGVEVGGRRQGGELVPWSRALERLAEGRLDVAVQELDWATLHAVGLPAAAYPVVAITNLCVNSDACLLQVETARALRSLAAVRAAVRTDGALVLNGEDFAVSGSGQESAAKTVLAALSRDTPLVRSHLQLGGTAAWIGDGRLLLGDAGEARDVGRAEDLGISLGGVVGFQLHNALTAAAVAAACGLPAAAIAAALRLPTLPAERMPGSFNVVPLPEALAIVDRPAPSWFLRPALRAATHLRAGRLLSVVGALDGVPVGDLVETGRLLGRGGGALVLHGHEPDSERGALLRQGIAANDVPPVILVARSERAAIARALAMLRPDDLLFVLADRPANVLRALRRVGVDDPAGAETGR